MRRVIAFVLFVSAPSVFGAQPVLTPGLWEITIRTEGREGLPPMTTVVCISREEAEDPKPPQSKASDRCKVTEGGRSGNVLSYTTRCAGADDHSRVRFTYSGDRLEGATEGKSNGRNYRQIYEGRRIGECEELPTAPSR